MVSAAPRREVEGEDPRWRSCSTDCVFFLVSRFTCTKGSKCEYRHCDGARFNPRNCWYWFHGNCVNPSCTFRHPPLENFNRTKSLADPPSSYGSTCFKKAKPCYFYYNSCCTKGDHCPFLHEPLTPNNVVGIPSEATTFSPAVIDNSAGDVMVEASKYANANPCQDTSYHVKKCHSKEVPESSNPEFDGAISIEAETSVDTGEYMKCFTLSDQCSGDSTMEHTEEDECRDSSPGFDVLVDDGLSNKNHIEQQLARKRDAQVLHVEYDIGDPVCYDQDHYDSEYYGQAFCGFDDQHGYFYLGHLEGFQEHDIQNTLGHNRRKLVRSTSDEYNKRFFNPKNFISSVADVVFVHQQTQTRHTSKRRCENRKGARGRKGRIKRRQGLEPMSVSQEIESKSTHPRQDSLMEECPQPVVCSTFRGQKKKSRGKQHHVLSARSSEHPTTDFTRPKTLAQIKEEKCISKSSFGHSAARVPHERSFSNDFEGPKSLTELLKAKDRISIGKDQRKQRERMAELQRSSQTFRRSGSSGLIWDERLMSEDQKQRDQGETGEAEESSLESKELRHSHSVGSSGTAQRGCGDGVQHVRSNNGNQAYRTRHVPPALDPPSPKVPRCLFCGIFRKEELSQPSKPRRY